MSKTAAQRQKVYREKRKQKEGANYFKSESSRVRKYYVTTNSLSECQKHIRRQKTRDYVRNHRRAARACRDDIVSSKTEGKVVPDDSNIVPDNINIVPDDINTWHTKSPTSRALRQKAYRERKKQKEGSNYLKCESYRVKKYYKKTDSLSECEKRIRREKSQKHLRNHMQRRRELKACREGSVLPGTEDHMVPAYPSSSSSDVHTAMVVNLPGIAPWRHSERRARTGQGMVSEAHVIDDVNDEKCSLLTLVESVGTMGEELVCTTEKYVYVPSSIATAEVEEGTHVNHQEEPDNVNNVCHAECFNGLVKMEVFNEEHINGLVKMEVFNEEHVNGLVKMEVFNEEHINGLVKMEVFNEEHDP